MGGPYLKCAQCALHTKPEPIHGGNLQRAVQSKGERGWHCWWVGRVGRRVAQVAHDTLNMRLLLCEVALQPVAFGVLTKEEVALI